MKNLDPLPLRAEKARILASQIRTVEIVDASLTRTRLSFQVEDTETWRDTVTLRGFVSIAPGTRMRLILDYIDEGGV